MNPLKPLVLLVFASTLSACGGLRSGEPPVATYVLRAAPTEIARPPRPLDYSITVLMPVARPGLAGDSIALLTSDHRIDRYAATRWADTLPRMVEALAVNSLRQSGVLSTVNESNTPFGADFLLRIDVTAFEARYAGARPDKESAPTVVVRLECSLARRADRVVVASFIAESSSAAAANRMSDVIAAFDRAAQASLLELRRQTLQAVVAQSATP